MKHPDHDSLEVIGKRIIMSAVGFESSVAALLDSESEKLKALVDHFRQSGCDSDPATIKDLMETNHEIAELACCLSRLERSIVEKISIGRDFLDRPDASEQED